MTALHGPQAAHISHLRYARCGGLVGCVRAGGPDRSKGEGGAGCVCARLSFQAPGGHTPTHSWGFPCPVQFCPVPSPASDHPPFQPTQPNTHTPPLNSLPLPQPLTHPVALTCNYRPSKAHRCREHPGQPALPQATRWKSFLALPPTSQSRKRCVYVWHTHRWCFRDRRGTKRGGKWAHGQQASQRPCPHVERILPSRSPRSQGHPRRVKR